MNKRDRNTVILFAALAVIFAAESIYSCFFSTGGYVGLAVYGLIAAFYVAVAVTRAKKFRVAAKNEQQALEI